MTTKQTFISPQMAVDIEYQPRIAALEAENKALWKLLRELHKVVTEAPDVVAWLEADEKKNQWNLLAVRYHENAVLSKYAYRAYRAWKDGSHDGKTVKQAMDDLYDLFAELEVLDELESEEIDDAD